MLKLLGAYRINLQIQHIKGKKLEASVIGCFQFFNFSLLNLRGNPNKIFAKIFFLLLKKNNAAIINLILL